MRTFQDRGGGTHGMNRVAALDRMIARLETNQRRQKRAKKDERARPNTIRLFDSGS